MCCSSTVYTTLSLSDLLIIIEDPTIRPFHLPVQDFGHDLELNVCKSPIEHLVDRGEGKKQKKPMDPKQSTLSAFAGTKKTQVSPLETQEDWIEGI